ncbi:MAG: hypothetical protein K2G55_12775 [Lachnospiraceae bacterium]|nr:hypothetical protein [Lachnospiraceae bacterium]MDE7205270.1 hypothetical protein [Lachnospiraceae bacterium]
MNFIDRAFEQKLSGDDFLQAMADIFSEPEVRKVLHQYPKFVSDVISVIEYDTALVMDGFDDIINGNLSERCAEIIDALERCGAKQEADILRKAKELSDTDETRYDEEYDSFCSQLALNNDYEGFWDIVQAYIDKNLVAP